MFSAFFNMKENPFGETPNTRFFFKSAAHMAAFRRLAPLLQTGRGFALLYGEVGLGKTILCRVFLNLLAPHADTALLFNSKVSGAELVKSIADEFGVAPAPSDSLQAQIDRITGFLLDNAKRGRRSVLFIDEAQGLSVDNLELVRLLSNLETETQKLLQIILVAQPELNEQLKRPELRQLNQRIADKIPISPMDLQDTETYIRHRIDLAGGANFVRFEEKAMKAIFNETGGVPRLINFLCERLLGAAEKAGIRIITPDFVARVIGSTQMKSKRSALARFLFGGEADL